MALHRHFACALILATAATAAGVQTRRPTPTPTPTPAPVRVKSLGDVAASIRLKKPAAAPGRVLVITNENLAELAAGGELTEVTEQATAGGTARVLLGSSRPDAGGGDREHWRGLYLEQVTRIETLEARRLALESQIPALWNQFYAWDDPAYRDGVIKPQLDAAMQELEQIKALLPAERAKLPQIVQDARRDGAEPGWFRDLPRP